MLHAPLGSLSKLASDSAKAPNLAVGTITRPANTTAYAVKDAIFGAPPTAGQPKAIAFDDAVGGSSGSGYIVSAMLISSAAPATKLDADLLLYSEEPATAPVDNDVFAQTPALRAALVAVVTFAGSVGKEVGGDTVYSVAVNQAIECAADSKKLYGVLIARNAYTPVSGEQLIIKLSILPRGVAVI